CKTEAERQAAGDPRPALLERYRGFDEYLVQFTAAAARLAELGYLLPEDLPRLAAIAKANQALFAR
ncbi:MAG TPA: hypothetical protein VFW87_21355, partial [Pirellulales bacterium]|nr:hypothetical protein [Pirellulales bacterium]